MLLRPEKYVTTSLMNIPSYCSSTFRPTAAGVIAVENTFKELVLVLCVLFSISLYIILVYLTLIRGY